MTDLIDKLNRLEGKTPDEIASALKPRKVFLNEIAYSIIDLNERTLPGPDLRAFAAAFRDSGRFFDSLGGAAFFNGPISLDRASRRGRL